MIHDLNAAHLYRIFQQLYVYAVVLYNQQLFSTRIHPLHIITGIPSGLNTSWYVANDDEIGVMT